MSASPYRIRIPVSLYVLNPLTHMKTTPVTTLLLLAFTAAGMARTVPIHATANLVLGQQSFVSNNSTTAADRLDTPSGITMDRVTGKIFVADYRNHRVLRYASASTLASGAAAEAVLGQADFTTGTAASPPTDKSMNRPNAVFVDHLGRLWVSDRNNARVLRFSNASTIASHTSADRVYGQPDFVSNTFNVTASGMINPTGVWVDGADRLWVSDEASCRVLRFDGITNKANGAAADGVLGQTSFTIGSEGSGASGLQRPTGIAITPGGSLFVACQRGNRVLRFDRAATLPNGAAASAVLGQSNFDDTATGLSAGGMDSPNGLAIAKDETLWVCDQTNNRILRYDKASTRASGAIADGVIGQPDFVSGTSNTTAQGLSIPEGGMLVDAAGSLWVTDYGNNRVLRFPATASKPLVRVNGRFPAKTKRATITIRGTASDPNGVSRILHRTGNGAWSNAAGTTTWQFTRKLKKGKNKITIFAQDPWGDQSIPRVITVTRK